MESSKAEGKRIMEAEEDEEEEEDEDGAAEYYTKKRAVDFSGRMVTCQVENCTADMKDAKAYHRRHKVCEQHSKAGAVDFSGIAKRFCQQCSRFHELTEFDENKRSCRRRLAGHNQRRRKSPHGSSGEA